MNLKLQTPAQSLNPAYRKQDVTQSQIITLRNALKTLFDRVDEQESEENLKNVVSDFLKDAFYRGKYDINTNNNDDLIIRNGKTIKDSVGVLMEFKQPNNKAQMISAAKPNVKAFHELILYYLDETNLRKEHQIKHLVATDGWQWFIFDENWFEKNVFRNSKLQSDWKQYKVSGHKTDHFYDFIAAKFLDGLADEIPVTYLNLKDFQKIIQKDDRTDDEKLIDLYKILSPEHLLKKPFANDSNTLNTGFYNELLYILGLEETVKNSKRVIERKAPSERHEGSLIENTINSLKRKKYFGYDENDEVERQYYDLGLELCITWLNRILFLKLLEGQLVKYHALYDKADYHFLNTNLITTYDELEELFFEVLAATVDTRNPSVKTKFGNIPYLNSSLFEATEYEQQYLGIDQLKNRLEMPVFSSTVLKNDKGKRVTGNLSTLQYIFDFLNSYNFASDSSAKIQKQDKTLINASVLGLIFEKINGYKDGSFFTPSFITMYMCKEVMEKAVLKRFNEENKWECETIADLRDKINYTDKKERKKANAIVDSVKICDPSVGSGHFLVSALNEFIALKSRLGILSYRDESRVQGWEIKLDNDELIITDTESEKLFNYTLNQNNNPIPELQQLQEALFHEKQKIIENCLFGVDINPKSVLICRLRLWIELLKNSYYTSESKYQQLETLPNIDINIKCGNSLMNRFAINDKNNLLPKDRPVVKQLIERYKIQVDGYKNAPDKRSKDDYRRQIGYIRNELQKFIFNRDKDYLQLKKKEAELLKKQSEITFTGEEERKVWAEQLNQLAEEANNLRTAYENKMQSLYKNALEWRFEFPEVLDKEGIFEGFDIIIGNPPYIKEYEKREVFDGLRDKDCYQGKMDLWYLFGDLGLKLLKPDSYLCFIATNNWVTNAGASNFRNIVLANSKIENLTDFGAYMIFDSASIQTMIMLFKNDSVTDNYEFDYRCVVGDKPTKEAVLNLLAKVPSDNAVLLNPVITKKNLKDKSLLFTNDENSALLDKIKAKQNFNLREKQDRKKGLKSEVGQGIVAPQDFVNKASADTLSGKVKVGDGIFVLSQSEYQSIPFTAEEKKIIKPYFTTEQLQKYNGSKKNTFWLLYTKSDINQPDKVTGKVPIDGYPNIKKHLDTFRDVITSDYWPYGLHRAREQHFFEGPKIIALRKCPKEPIFTYTDFDCYVSQTFFVIQSDRINLKYLTALFNSRLIQFWLRRKGKMQGNSYQLDKEPILEIPIYKPDKKKELEIASLVDEVISAKVQGGGYNDTIAEIDKQIYTLYNITSEEQKLIESQLKS